MEFLKQILGEGYDLFAEQINAYNEANPENPVSIANVSDGGYVEKSVYDSAVAQLGEKTDAVAGLENSIKKCKFDAALDIALAKSGAKNTLAVRALLTEVTDETKIEEAIETVKRENPYLFSGVVSTGMSQGTSASSFNATDEIRNTLFGKNK